MVEIDWIEDTPEKIATIYMYTANEHKSPVELREEKSKSISKDFLWEQSASSLIKQNEDKQKSFMFFKDKTMLQSQLSMPIGYDIFQFINNSEDKTYLESGEIPKDKGITLCNTHQKNKYKIEVYPKSSKTLIYRLSRDVYKESENLGYNSVLGDNKLIQKCKEIGRRT